MNIERAVMDFKASLRSDGILTRYDQIALLEVFEVIEKEIVDMYKRIIEIEIQLRRIS